MGDFFLHVGCRIHYALSPGIHRRWFATRTELSVSHLWGFIFTLYILYTKIINWRKKSASNTKRWGAENDDNTPPHTHSSVLKAPQAPTPLLQPSLWCSGQLQGPDLHYWDRALTARPPCHPHPSRHTARQYTLAHLPLFASSVFFPWPGPKNTKLLSERILLGCKIFLIHFPRINKR